MEDEDIKAEHGPAIDAFLSAQEHKSSSIAMANAAVQQEMTETPIRTSSLANAHPNAATTPSAENGAGAVTTPRRHKPYSKTTVVNLVSTNATSSAFPESFGFGISVSGRWLAAYSSSALYLLSAWHLPSYKGTCRAFRIRRKPLAVAITDTGRFAVLTTSHKIDIYQCGQGLGDLLQGTCRKLETIHLDNEAKTLAFARCGEIVAAGSDVGLEIKSLSQGSRETDKRYITCSPADRLVFARDGRGLLATSVAKKSRFSTFIALNESFEDAFAEEEEIEQQPLGKLWITQLLFPERLSCRLAALLPLSTTSMSNSEILAFDSHMDMFKVMDVSMKRFTNRELGTPHGVIWTRHHKPEESLPAISADASAIAFAVKTKTDKELWVYHVPAAWWEAEQSSSPESAAEGDFDNNLDAAVSIKLPALEEGRPPETITSLQWVESSEEERDRLVAIVSTINVAMPEEAVPIEAPAASGKVFLFDFEDIAQGRDGSTSSIVVDLGEVAVSDELTDEVLALEREVDLVRRRTQMQRNRPPAVPLPSPRTSLRRSMSSGSTPGSGVPTLRDLTHSNSGRSTSGRSNSGRSARRRRSFSSLSSANDGQEEGSVLPVEEPYSQSQPRSQFSLQRAATIAANAPANRHHLRALPDRPLEYRRADGLREMPHESDADNWVPPPPLYSERPDNVVSHPINQQAEAAYVPTPRRAPSLTQHRLSRPLSNVPPMPPLPANVRAQYTPQRPAVMHQQTLSTTTPVQRNSSQTLPVGHAHTRSRNSNDSGSSAASRLLGRPLAAGTLLTGHHRNAESASSIASRGSQNHVAAQQVNHFSPPVTLPQQQPSQASVNNMAAAAVAAPISLVTHGLPPNMTPPSPLAEFVRPSAVRQDTPSPSSPTSNQLSSVHRRSGSDNPAPQGPLGAQNETGSLRITTPVSVNHGLPEVPGFAPGSSLSPSRSSPRSERRPNMSRLATIASVAEHQPLDEDFAAESRIQTVVTTPETPVTRKPWWRVGGAGNVRGVPRADSRQTMRSDSRMARPDSRMTQSSRQVRPESRINQYAPGGDALRHAATAPVVAMPAKKTKEKEKDGGGSRCIVM